MQIYNPKAWITIFIVSKADTLRILFPYLLLVLAYSYGVAYLEIEYLQLHKQKDTWVKNIPVIHSLLGFAISILLVFRTNTAYDRWWEGRKQWGNLVNNSRNFAIQLNSFLAKDDIKTRKFFGNTIPLYGEVLREHLQLEKTRLALDESEISKQYPLNASKHGPNQIARILYQKVFDLHKNEQINNEQLIILNKQLTIFTDICGACERIKNTPIPLSYSSFIKRFIFIYVATLPFGYVFSLGYYVAPIVALVFYVLASLEIIAEEIEDPFGTDINDLPMQKIAQNIRVHIEEILT